MKKRKSIIGICLSVVFILITAFLFIQVQNKENMDGKPKQLKKVKQEFVSDIEELQNGKYKNLVSIDFESSIKDVEGVYNIELLSNNSFLEKTYLENLTDMETAIDKFFGENFDKSFLNMLIYPSDGGILEIPYHDIEKEYTTEMYEDTSGMFFLSGNNTAGDMVQICTGYLHTWFSKNGFGTIHPSAEDNYKKVYPYISCLRQVEDVVLQLKDGEVPLAELEETALTYMNSDAFPLPINENIQLGIAEARVLDCGEYEGVCFRARRIYKGIPFEYGSNFATEPYIDNVNHDGSELSYVESTSPDTMLSFYRFESNVVETEEITELFSAGDALAILSESIGENSTYEVHGVELVYRGCEIPEEREQEVTDILTPRWKVITTNQNDNKYTLFYIDVVTGEITERFEYYYE